MKTQVYLVLCLIGLLSSCRNTEPKTSESLETLTSEGMYPVGDYYFGTLDASSMEAGKYNVQLMHIRLDSSNHVRGEFYYQPYGSDGSRGSLAGRLDRDSMALFVKRRALAEGERYSQDLILSLTDTGLELGYDDENGEEMTLPRIEKDLYEQYWNSFKAQQLGSQINSSDRTRLQQLQFLKDNGLTPDDLSKLKFMEVMVELNNDYNSKEYLLYIMDPLLCGSGGCNLFVVDETGHTLSYTTVTRPPIYVPVLSFEEQQAQQGEWKNLFVYSDGMRQLSFENGHYTANASRGVLVDEVNLSTAPELYMLVMDYME